MKSKTVALLLWLFLGWLSAHRFYTGKTGSAILYLLTGQLFGIGWIIDLFLIGGMVEKANLQYAVMNGGGGAQNVVVNLTAPAPTAAPVAPVANTQQNM